jgi:hypothetical protein
MRTSEVFAITGDYDAEKIGIETAMERLQVTASRRVSTPAELRPRSLRWRVIAPLSAAQRRKGIRTWPRA